MLPGTPPKPVGPRSKIISRQLRLFTTFAHKARLGLPYLSTQQKLDMIAPGKIMDALGANRIVFGRICSVPGAVL